jgi:segregation and condensation protein B
VDKIADILKDFPKEKILKEIENLMNHYKNNEHGIQLIKVGGGYLFTTKPEHDKFIRQLLINRKQIRLSRAAIETLAVIAYYQPVTLSEINSLRGVDSTYTLRTLLRHKLVKIIGRKNVPGRPLLYRTTKKFLIHFGLNSLNDLPSIEELEKIIEEKHSSF